MGKLISLATIFILTCGTLGTNNCLCCNPKRTVKKTERKERVEKEVRNNVLESAKRWLFVTETTGRNDHPMIEKSMKLCGLCGTCGYPWCASCQTEIFVFAGIETIRSARAADWFKQNVVWRSSWGTIPKELLMPGMVVGYYYHKLGRVGHIGLLVGWDKNNLYVYEGNTSPRGLFNPENFQSLSEADLNVVREGDGFYPKTRRWTDISVISDKCLQGNDFIRRYDDYLQKAIKSWN